jgi:hypothetical protein
MKEMFAMTHAPKSCLLWASSRKHCELNELPYRSTPYLSVEQEKGQSIIFLPLHADEGISHYRTSDSLHCIIFGRTAIAFHIHTKRWYHDEQLLRILEGSSRCHINSIVDAAT